MKATEPIVAMRISLGNLKGPQIAKFSYETIHDFSIDEIIAAPLVAS
jgi:hypothetical protein